MARDASAEAKWMRRIESAGGVLERLGQGVGCKALPGANLDEMRILLPGERRGDVLVVLKASIDGVKYVAFVGGPDVVTAVLMLRAKERAQGVKWRVDEWVPSVDDDAG